MCVDYRNMILDLVKSEFIGPCPEENPVDENGEEIIKARGDGDSPLARYSVGVLYPRMQVVDELGNVSDEGGDAGENSCEDGIVGEGDEGVVPSFLEIEQGEFYVDEGRRRKSDKEPEDDPVSLSNAYHQSAASLTVCVPPDCPYLEVSVAFARYEKAISQGSGRREVHYYRKPYREKFSIPKSELPPMRKHLERWISSGSDTLSLRLVVTSRETHDSRTRGVYTISLVNESSGRESGKGCSRHAFQVEIAVHSIKPFPPIQDGNLGSIDDYDYRNNQLLYRDILTYGIGHGCAAAWDQEAEEVYEVRTDFMPSYEVRPIIPGARELVFDMLDMSIEENRDSTIETLENLCNSYNQWIAKQKEKAECFDSTLRSTAFENLENCADALARICEGVRILKEDDVAFKAFALMNEAMLAQQLHYRKPLAKWEGGRNGKYVDVAPEPVLYDRCTWPSDGVYGRWRTFQIAFVLMNIKSMRYEDCGERDVIDLIWFPTGGGKTEAYLGLTAFTLFIRRLLNKENDGVTVLMRYTLRLLTTQQFERAVSLICACEIIRERMPDALGTKSFAIGLWVGQATSPNKQSDAVSQLKKMTIGERDDNPFILLKCPWCGAQMGIVGKQKKDRVVLGYENKVVRARRRSGELFHYVCSNRNCHFSADGVGELPVYSVDEDIYEKRPSLVIGTVDKFTAIATKAETRNLFGRGVVSCSPPDLIIQDELHLISGPLGSMVGFYETAIDELCKDDAGNHAKIVGSTATISHAKEQCSALYCRSGDQISQFPPSGIDAGDSFFAIEESDPSKPGRLYVGLCAPGSSMAMSVINLYASLLLAFDLLSAEADPSVTDGYATNLGYFNSLRELGQAATWISGNILENYSAMQYRRRKKDSSFVGRYPNSIKSCELTSRISSDEIPSALKRLEVGYTGKKATDKPVDICLATNMVSVGVDIPRLALMTVDGQPKTTSEYIQATSRVGRGKNPGLVFTIYSPTKPRDKSHYEDFQRYHSRLYCNVEPTSVTPFSAPLRDRALRALLVALVRQLCPVEFVDDPSAVSDELFKRVERVIVERAKRVDVGEAESTESQIRRLISDWKAMEPQNYTSSWNDETTPLVMITDSSVNPAWLYENIWVVPSSMRNVDASCIVKQLPGGYFGEI